MPNRTVYVTGSASGTPGTNGATYTTLAAALSGESGAAGDLVTGTCILSIEVQITTHATSTIDIDGFTTSALYYLNIYTSASARHAGAWSDSKYAIASVDDYCMYVREDYVRITGLQFTITSPSAARTMIGNIGRTAGAVVFDRCIFKGHGNATYQLRLGGVISGIAATYYFNNTIFYAFGGHTGSYITANADNTWALRNCTVIMDNAADFAVREDGGDLTCYNCYAAGGSSAAFFGGIAGDFNASDDTSADSVFPTGINSVPYTTTTFDSVTPGDATYLQLTTGSALINAGQDGPFGSSGDPEYFTADIVGTARSSWDIGAFEFVVVGGQPLTKRHGGVIHAGGRSPLGVRRW